MNSIKNRLSESEVRDRLKACSDPEVINEIYSFGQILLNETLKNTKDIDSKAASMAVYGGAIVTALMSTSQSWLKTGAVSVIIGTFCGLTAFTAAIFAVRAMRLTTFEWLSEKEWLEESCLAKIEKLKKYRVLTMWGTMDSHKNVYGEKISTVKRSQLWLSLSVGAIFLLLLNLVWRINLG